MLASELPTPALAAAKEDVESGVDAGIGGGVDSVVAVPGTVMCVPQIGHLTDEPANSGAMLTCWEQDGHLRMNMLFVGRSWWGIAGNWEV